MLVEFLLVEQATLTIEGDDLCTKANLTIKICELDTHFGENWNNLWISVATK